MAGAELIGRDELPSIMTGFGAGISRQGSLCGALTGGIAAIGLSVGRVDGSDKEAKERVYRTVDEFTQRFHDKFGSVSCTDLCECDLTTQDGRERFMREDRHNKVCVEFVLGAIDLLKEFLP